MASPQPLSSLGEHPANRCIPIFCLLGVVVLLSSITPTMKYVFQHSGLNVLDVAIGRVVIGFLFLAGITVCMDWRGLRSMRAKECVHLGVVGVLGVGAYAVAAGGLRYTSVTHYALVYSLLPTFTALFSCCFGNDRPNGWMCCGILLSWTGCVMAISGDAGFLLGGFGIGDALALLFSLMMSAHIVLSAPLVKRHGVLRSNTAMFGTSALLLSGGQMIWGAPLEPSDLSPSVVISLLFIGLGTAGVFLLRCRSLRSLSPATVGAYHNLIPICTIGVAHLSLGEPLSPHTMIGATAVLLGTELVRRAPFLTVSLRWLTWALPIPATPAPALVPLESSARNKG